MNSYSAPVVGVVRPPAERFRSRRPKDDFAEAVFVEEDLREVALIEEVLVRDVRARLTPSDMVDRKLIAALSQVFHDGLKLAEGG